MGAVAVLPTTGARSAVLHEVVHRDAVTWSAIGVAATAVLALVLWRSRLSRTGLSLAGGRGAGLLLHLWPVVTLTAVYPIASTRMAGHQVGGVDMTVFLLAVALTLPWLLQGACLPMYRSIGALVHEGDVTAMRRGFCAAVPGTIVQAVPAVLISALPLVVLLHWSPRAIGAFVGLLVLDVMFAQSLVLANVTRARGEWVAGWSAYAAAVFIAPTWWWLPPLAGLLTQMVPLRRHLLTRPVWLGARTAAGDMAQGVLLGAVMWGDKVFYFYRTDGDFPVITLFLASLPAIIAYNFYFVCRSPDFDSSIKRLHTAMENEPLNRLQAHSEAVYRTAIRSMQDSAFVGAVLVGLTAVLLWSAAPDNAALIGGIAVAGWLSAVISIACYKLEYVDERRATRIIGGSHLLLCAAVFASPIPASSAYLSLVAGDVVILLGTLLLFRRTWKTPEHTLFWRRALNW
ncbi:hypothetical protein [Jidongwangia harbinensis]|uniref:hypothetical protein n=1 Tax=Jidongwangia harbinensis TaxID=2878561 RepID=UPI001CDA0C4B|nr:hypothetical protein [Jidongwangia harbinensis]MCA2215462.1 hypothetical protein [Jidongwangia harbinensis]